MSTVYQRRRAIAIIITLIIMVVSIAQVPNIPSLSFNANVAPPHMATDSEAISTLDTILVKGRAPKTGYSRAMFGPGWATKEGCDTRNIILNRDLKDIRVNNMCKVLTGVLHDPYTGTDIQFVRGADTSDDIQIDHVVALSDAWQKGAQQLSYDRRVMLANDPLNLLAVSGDANQQKSDGDAATWLPENKAFRCQYIARQIAVKVRYELWVTDAERNAMAQVLQSCQNEPLPTEAGQ